VRYIHLNPVRAHLVGKLSELNRYAYCGHSALMGYKKRPWQDVNPLVAKNIGEIGSKKLAEACELWL
jgi:hypothetical protein